MVDSIRGCGNSLDRVRAARCDSARRILGARCRAYATSLRLSIFWTPPPHGGLSNQIGLPQAAGYGLPKVCVLLAVTSGATGSDTTPWHSSPTAEGRGRSSSGHKPRSSTATMASSWITVVRQSHDAPQLAPAVETDPPTRAGRRPAPSPPRPRLRRETRQRVTCDLGGTYGRDTA